MIYRSSRIKEYRKKWDGELESVYFMVKVHFYPHVSDKFLHLNGSLFHTIHTWIFQGVQWMDDGAEKHHTVGFKYHTFEDVPFLNLARDQKLSEDLPLILLKLTASGNRR